MTKTSSDRTGTVINAEKVVEIRDLKKVSGR